jgi:hypothetical protein
LPRECDRPSRLRDVRATPHRAAVDFGSSTRIGLASLETRCGRRTTTRGMCGCSCC